MPIAGTETRRQRGVADTYRGPITEPRCHPPEVAGLLHFPRQTVKRYAQPRLLPNIRLARDVIRYDPESLNPYLAQLQQPSTHGQA